MGHFPTGLDSLDDISTVIYSQKQAFPIAVKKMIGYRGAFQIFNVFPANPQEEEEGWLVEQRALVLLDPGCRVESSRGEFQTNGYPCSTEFRQITERGRKALAKSVGLTCRYPRQIVFGSKQQIFDWLYRKRRIWIPEEQRRCTWQDVCEERGPRAFKRNSGVRLMEFYGELRNRAARKREAAVKEGAVMEECSV